MTTFAKKKFHIQAADGVHEVQVGLEDYKEAADKGMSLSALMQQKYGQGVSVKDHGSVFLQMCAQSGLYTQRDVVAGFIPPTMAQLLTGGVQAGPITAPDGTDNSPSGRFLFPELVLALMEVALSNDQTDFLSGLEDMVGITQTISGDVFYQPLINLNAPKDVANMPIAQGAEPVSLVSISLTEKIRSIPTKAIGLTITDKALQASTLDLVGLVLTEQAREERVRRWTQMLAGMISGDADSGESAIGAAVNQTALDPSAAAGTMTQLAWLKWLRRYYQKMKITHAMCSLETALKIETRTGRPGLVKDMLLDANFTVSNLMISEPRILLVDDSICGANTIIGLDKSKAIRRVINVQGNYQAIERFVLSKTTAYRFDYSEMAHKLFPEAWDRMVIV